MQSKGDEHPLLVARADRMANKKALDRSITVVLESPTFQEEAITFLRKRNQNSDSNLRTAADESLRKTAKLFCDRQLKAFCLDTSLHDPATVELVRKEVFRIYRKHKVGLLNKILRKPLLSHTLYPPEQIVSSESSWDGSQTATSMQIESNTPPATTSKGRRRRRPSRRRRRPKTRDKELIPMVFQEENDFVDSGIDQDSVHEGNDVGSDGTKRTDKMNKPPVSIHNEQWSTTPMPEQTSDSYLIKMEKILARLRTLETESLQVLAANKRLQFENQMLAEYGTLVQHTLHVCQDTHIEEAKSAAYVRLHSKTIRCDAVVGALDDLRKDLDLKAFRRYFRKHARRPPTRYWLDSVYSWRKERRREDP